MNLLSPRRELSRNLLGNGGRPVKPGFRRLWNKEKAPPNRKVRRRRCLQRGNYRPVPAVCQALFCASLKIFFRGFTRGFRRAFSLFPRFPAVSGCFFMLTLKNARYIITHGEQRRSPAHRRCFTVRRRRLCLFLFVFAGRKVNTTCLWKEASESRPGAPSRRQFQGTET